MIDDGTVLLVPAFADADICAGLTRHFLTHPDFVEAAHGGRFNNRFTARARYPQSVYDMRARIRALLELSAPIYEEGHGIDGIVASYMLPGARLPAHTDPRPPAPRSHVFRCNVVLAGAPQEIVVADRDYKVGRGDMMCYLVSKHAHYMPPVQELRALLMFGFVVPEN